MARLEKNNRKDIFLDSDIIIKIVVVFILLLLSVFFSSAETALSMSNKVRLKALMEAGDKRAKTALKVLDDYSSMLSAILIGNNLVNLYASSIVTALAMKLGLNTGLATLLLTVMVLLFCEIIPKNISAIKSESLALAFAGIINFVMKILTPIIFLVNGFGNIFLKIIKLDASEHESMTESELRTYVDESHKDGVIETDEKEMIINVFNFGDTVAKDVMIPRVDMVTLDEDSTLDEVREKFRENMYTRFPVCEQGVDNIIGFINIKDFIKFDDSEDFDLHKILRKPFFTLEYRKTADLLSDMRKERVTLAFVLNEYGGCEGMVTIEDLLEEIVGEIRDEYDADEEELIQKMSENAYLIEGSMKLDDINDALETELTSEDYDSIGGLVIENLEDRLPEDGDVIKLPSGIELRVQGMSQNRISKVLMILPENEDTDEENDDAEQ